MTPGTLCRVSACVAWSCLLTEPASCEMPRKLKAKSQKKKKVKKPKAASGSVEEQFRKATLEVDVLQDHLALQRQVTRQAQLCKYDLHGKLQELHEDIQEERDEKQAIYSDVSQKAFQLLSEESQCIAMEKEAEIEELKKQVERMETDYEHIIHCSLDRILSTLTLAGQRWAKESLSIHQQHKVMLQDCGLNPLHI
ncbi:dynein regulatory complex protein 12 isoform X3 [Rhinoderma darwinii]|uniref:dynein regulatory complex protein 12 isoform X3 n=1 Tax=Rhinoderma darwinii TaxID=43563 RepID=UPI003F672485